MFKVIELLLHGCWHHWVRAPGQPIDHYDISFGPKSFLYRAVPRVCAKCGRHGEWKDKTGGAE